MAENKLLLTAVNIIAAPREALEALVLCLLGGLVGVIIGYGIGAVAASLIPGFPPAHTPLWAVTLALGFSAVVGVVFGILPAAKAANLDPIASLRYE